MKKYPWLTGVLTSLLALLISLLVADILILIYGAAPREIFQLLIGGTLLNSYGFGQVLFKTTPLILAGLAVALAFKAGLFNIGGEGQLYTGAFTAAVAGFLLPKGLPALIVVPLCMLAAFGGGAAAGAIPGWLRARYGSHEVINTLMLNFILLALINYLVTHHLHVPETLHTPEIIPQAHLARMGEWLPMFKGSALNLALFLSLICCGAVYFLLWKTRLGYELRAVGHNPAAAEAAGINVGRITILAMTLSGGMAGLIGVNFVLGYKYYFEEGFSSGLGFMGIAVALLGRNHPLGVIPAALLFGLLSQGGLVINAVVPKELIDILQAVVILAMVCTTAGVRKTLEKEGV
jgi:ABC-type uncharacterized transport system permease subunit